MIDSHCHLDADKYQPDWVAVLDRAQQARVVQVVAPALHLDSAETLLAMAHQDTRLSVAVGIHPHEAKRWEGHASAQRIRELAPGAVAVGETGLEFFYDFVEPEQQLKSLRGHLELAEELELPLILHCREAEELLYEELRTRKLPAGGVVHCFTGEWSWGEKFVNLGFHLGITGMVTFKKALNMQETAKRCPLERLLVETDGPYLAPIPYRGKTNFPEYIPLIVAQLAQLRGISAAEVAEQTSANTRNLFGLTEPAPSL